MSQVLDVGCGLNIRFGGRPKGSVNCDRLRPTRMVKNFVLCDAHHLPFRPAVFGVVLLYDVIEHVDSPTHAIGEACRVSKDQVRIGTPNASYILRVLMLVVWGKYRPHADHIQTWGKAELENLLNRLGVAYAVRYVTYLRRGTLKERLLAVLPFEGLKHRQLEAIICVREKRGVSGCVPV